MLRKQILFFSLAALMFMAFSASGATKMIAGFERAEMETKAGGLFGAYSANCVTDADSGFDFGKPFSGVTCASGPMFVWNIRNERKSEGAYALRTVIEYTPWPSTGTYETFLWTPYWSYYYPMLGNYSRQASLVIYPHGWFVSNPSLRDWSGYTKFWVDVYVKPRDGGVTTARTQVALEDEVITPPVMRRFDIPANTWVTVEVDIAQAVRERNINLLKMVNFWVLAYINSTVYLDNIRLAQAADAATLPLYRDTTTMALSNLQPASPILPAPTVSPNRTALSAPTAPVTVDSGNIVPCGFIGAFDNDHLYAAFNHSYYDGSQRFKPLYVRQTTNGGATWINLDSTRYPGSEPNVRWNMDHGSGRGNVIDMWGNAAWVSNTEGCYGFTPNPRQHVHLFDNTNGLWTIRTGTRMMDADTRHCGHSSNHIFRQRFGAKAGRLWSSWGNHGRMHAAEVGAAYSDDNGNTWSTPKPGYGPIPGSKGLVWHDDTYVMPETDITQYGEYAAVFWQDERGLLWSIFDGTDWGAPRVIHTGARFGENKPTVSAVTVGATDIYVTSYNMSGVMRWDGSVWHQELPTVAGGGVLTVCGDGIDTDKDRVMYFTAGDGKTTAAVNAFRKKLDGTWDGPIQLSEGTILVDVYNTWVGLSAQPYSPPNFAAVAWSTGGVLKMVKVPPADYVPSSGTFATQRNIPSNGAQLSMSPNPFNPVVSITAAVSNADGRNADLAIFSVEGKLVYSRVIKSNRETFSWDAKSLPNGVYVVRLAAGKTILTRQLTRLK